MTVAVHAGAAALWVGGLGAVLVLVAPHRALLDEVLPRFSRLAGGCVVAVGLTGLAQRAAPARILGGRWSARGYGGLVLAKIVLLVLLAGLGGAGPAASRRRADPGAALGRARGRADGRHPRRWPPPSPRPG